jgi:predicted PurR-regulated permease PerM
MMLALTGLIFGVVQIIQDALLVPRIMGKEMGLSPAMILLSLSIWGKLLGIFGLLIALPMTCLLVAYYRRFFTRAEVSAA